MLGYHRDGIHGKRATHSWRLSSTPALCTVPPSTAPPASDRVLDQTAGVIHLLWDSSASAYSNRGGSLQYLRCHCCDTVRRGSMGVSLMGAVNAGDPEG